MIRWPLIAAGGTTAAVGLTAALLGGWFLMAAGGADLGSCSGALDRQRVPAELAPLFDGAAKAYALGADGAAILAGLTKVESGFGRNVGPSSAGARGWTQFMPDTWARFGVDADGDGRRDPMSAADAIYSAARYLRHLGAPDDWRRALFGYNHAGWYVDEVLAAARALHETASDADALACATVATSLGSGAAQVSGGGGIVSIPGQPGESIDARLVPDLELLALKFHVAVADGYAPHGHAAGGEHPLGLAVDLVPGPGGTWDDVGALARWAEPVQDHPRAPFRWVGYDGDPGHGRGNHLHLSWLHAPVPDRRPPATWVEVLVAP